MSSASTQSRRIALLAIAYVTVFATTGGCPNTPCTSGLSVLLLEDANLISVSLRNALYASGPIVGEDDADFPNPPRMVIIRYETDDHPWNPEVTTDAVETDVFDHDVGSIRDFFYEISYGQFDIQNGGISEVVTIQADTTDFGDGTIGDPQTGDDWTRNPELARQLCAGSSIDWVSLDTNDDLTISPKEAQVCFLASIGGGGACRPNIVTVDIGDATYTINQRFVFFDCLSENDPREATQGNIRYNLGNITHELAHGIFCLPDRYGSQGFCGTGLTGRFDLMSDNCEGPYHFNIHDKMKIGWLCPRVLPPISTPGRPRMQCYAFQASETTPAALILIDPRRPGEYWMVENRFAAASAQRRDRGMPESGMCIWHVRTVTGGHDEVRLVDASRPDQDPLLYQNQTVGALFRGQTRVATSPRTLRFAGGAASPFLFDRISPAGSTMYGEF